MSGAVVETFEPVCTIMIGWLVSADDSAGVIDPLGLTDAAVIHVKDNGRDRRAIQHNSLVGHVLSDAGIVVVIAPEKTGFFDAGDTAVGPSNQAVNGAGTCIANDSAEIVNPERLDENRLSIVKLERGGWGKKLERARSLRLCLCS